MEGGRKQGKSGWKFVQDRYGRRGGPERHGRREGRKEGNGGKGLFRVGVVGNGTLNKREKGGKGR